jgi:hypothetical protein
MNESYQMYIASNYLLIKGKDNENSSKALGLSAL